MRLIYLIAFSFFLATGSASSQEINFDALKKGAASGDADAQLFLGLAYEMGQDLPKDTASAVYWYQRAAEQGHPEAQSLLGFAYNEGKIVPKDIAASAMWHKKAAQQGITNSQAALAGYYYLGIGVPKDYLLSYFWANIASSNGHKDAPGYRDMLEKYMTVDQIAEAQRLSSKWSPGKPIQ